MSGGEQRAGVGAQETTSARAHALSRAFWTAVYLAGAVLIAGLEYVWQGQSYWSFSDGVYLASARAIVDGRELYADIAAAQPPLLYYAGAAILAASDSIWWVRAALSLLGPVTGGLVALAVWRLSASAPAAVLAGLASLLAPWTLHEHATLSPETFAAPLLLGAALLGAHTRLLAIGGALGVAAAAFKLAFLLPVLAIGSVALRRTRFLLALAGLGLLASAAALVVWGGPLLEGTVVAQQEVGLQPGAVPGYLLQGAWNLAPLVALAALALRARQRLRDPALLRTLAALSLGALALLATVLKDGSYLNVLVVAEPPLVALAGAGLADLLARRRRVSAEGGPSASDGRVALKVAALAACVLLAAQSLSLIAWPKQPLAFLRPGSAPAHAQKLSSAEVSRAAADARACPAGAPYSGPPYVAFIADRALPGGQPDQFIVAESSTHAALRERIVVGPRACP